MPMPNIFSVVVRDNFTGNWFYSIILSDLVIVFIYVSYLDIYMKTFRGLLGCSSLHNYLRVWR